MNHFIPILNILIKKSNHQKIQEHAPSEFLHQASYVFAGELVVAAYNTTKKVHYQIRLNRVAMIVFLQTWRRFRWAVILSYGRGANAG
jgi:hypothetical protein